MKANYNFSITFLNGHRLERSAYGYSETAAHKEVWEGLSETQQNDVERMDLDMITFDSLGNSCK